MIRPIAILKKANNDRKKVVFKSRIDLFAIIANGIKYKPIPSDIEVIDTFNQFSLTIPAAIKTVPHTGGVIVDSNATHLTVSSISGIMNAEDEITGVSSSDIDMSGLVTILNPYQRVQVLPLKHKLHMRP